MLSTVAAAAVLLAGCGGDDQPTPPAAGQDAATESTSPQTSTGTPTTGPTKTTGGGGATADGPQAAALRVAQRYIDAYVEQDAKLVCQLLAEPVFAQLEAAGGCVKTVRTSFASAAAEKLQTAAATVEGTTARVTFQDSLRQVTLTQESGRWKVIDGGT